MQRNVQITDLRRRGKYLLLHTKAGTILIHLGMSGRLALLQPPVPLPQRHAHVDMQLDNGHVLRFRDPRRFGLMLWLESRPERHPLLASMGPDPFEPGCNPGYLAARAAGRRVALQPWLMDGRIIAGVGNIYAAETLFRARLHPAMTTGTVLEGYWPRLLQELRAVLSEAIANCGTTLRDFRTPDGTRGSHGTALRVYGRTGQPCLCCTTPIQRLVLRQRSSFFCPGCQENMGQPQTRDLPDPCLADAPGV
jgi:formamidopyrimidine-DNA glycosylase